jgi:hypothetical protein
MFSGLAGEKSRFWPFAFKMFPGLGGCVMVGHKVTLQPVGLEASKMCIDGSFWLRTPGGEAPGRAWPSARILPMPIAA